MTTMIKRKHQRVELDQPIAITDMISGEAFGELVNVTVAGLMVITNKEIPTHSIHQLSLRLPVDVAGSEFLEIGADCLWSRKTENFNRYWAGFQIIDASDTALAQIEELISHHGK